MPQSTTGMIFPRKIEPIIYVIDASGCLQGAHIGTINEAIRENLSYLRQHADYCCDFQIQIAVLKYSTNVEWITDGLVDIDDLNWNGVCAGGLTDLGGALRELNDKLSRKELFKSEIGFLRPIIVFIGSCDSTDNWEIQFTKLKDNRWFKVAHKVGFVVGDLDDLGYIYEDMATICGNQERVVQVDFEYFPKIFSEMHKVLFKNIIWAGAKEKDFGYNQTEGVFVTTDPIEDDDTDWGDDDWT